METTLESVNLAPVVQVLQGKNPFEKAAQLSIRFRKLGTSRKVKNLAPVEVDADKDWLSMSKKILQSDNLKAVNTLYTKIRAFLNSRCLPSTSYRESSWLIPYLTIPEVNSYILNARNTELPPLVDIIVAEYDELIATATAALRVLNTPAQFPPKDTVRQSFGIDFKFVEEHTPGKLKELYPDIFNAEVQKDVGAVESLVDNMQQALILEFAKLIDHAVDRLSPDAEGNKKAFYKSTISNIEEFLAVFQNKNIFNNTQLAELTSKTEALLNDVDPELLKKDIDLRDIVKAKFEEIKAPLDAMMVDKPKRLILMDEELV